MTSPAFRRIIRRETHSPRTVAAIVVAVVVILALVSLGIELVLQLAALPALLVSPSAAADRVSTLTSQQPSGAIIAAGVLAALLGLTLLVLALGPGRLAKHRMQFEGRAVLVDNGVIAAALAQHVSDETGIDRDDITVGVAHRVVDVTVDTDSGAPVDTSAIRDLVDAELENYRLEPSVRVRVRPARAARTETERKSLE